jgi:glycine dehydrogenase subunit 1
MRYTQLTDSQVEHMLGTIGAGSIDELFAPIPKDARLKGPLKIPAGISEMELIRDLESLAGKNRDCTEKVCFLGAGAYDHFIPTVVDAMAHQSEFVTAYTPYQAEASQGVLQLFYEFQTMICELTGMDVANASLYEGASAAAEAMLMAISITGRRRLAVVESAHPDTLGVLRTYAFEREIEVFTIPAPAGIVDEAALRSAMDDSVAAVLIQSPNFYGCIERLDRLIPLAQAAGAKVIVSADPLASGLLRTPGSFGADMVVGEGQALGIPMQYGGPYLGLLATREEHLRKMPGRVVGMAKDREGRRGFCLVLQTREQHIKRERATSNVCTNQGLLAIRASVYMATMGRGGIAKVASLCFDKAHYAAARIAELPGFSLRFTAPFFKEFVVRTTKNVEKLLAACSQRGILAGVPMRRFDERYADCFLVAVTEQRTKQQIDDLAAALKSA